MRGSTNGRGIALRISQHAPHCVKEQNGQIEGRQLRPEHLYEQAIRSAHSSGFIHNEALANELTARFYAERGFDKIAQMYLRDARYGYVRWGADGKVRQLDEMYPRLRMEAPSLGPMSTVGPMSTIGAPVEQLDLATVIKVLQAASGEIVPEKFMDTLMRTAIEQAGAERGLLVLARGTSCGSQRKPQPAAMRLPCSFVTSPRPPPDALLRSVLHYVMRARESMILDIAARPAAPFNEDPYPSASVPLHCVPAIDQQAELIGVLYLENNLAPRVFAPARIGAKLLASRAAISLENTRLFGDLQQREAKIRRLVKIQHHRRILSGSRRSNCRGQ